MPTECERSVTSPTGVQVSVAEVKDNLTTLTGFNEDLTAQTQMMEGDMSTSQTSTTSNGSSSCNGVRKTSITSPDPTAYVAKARVTRPTPPPPPYNPMQFVQIKPCNLYQTAQEQLKKAEEVKKIKEIRKEEPEDWQNNLDNWKSSRRKRVEHIIDRVVEVKKLELEEHDRTRRKSKTFSEMIEERGERSGGRGLNKLASLAVYAEDEANDLSDLGIGTSSASGKSSLSDDYDNNSVMSDNAAELDKTITKNIHNKPTNTESTTREYISSPGYETSSSTAPASSPDPCEYTYEGAIQDYKQRVSRAASGLTSAALNKLTISQRQNSKESTPERPFNKETAYPPRRGSKIEDRLMGFEVQSPSEECVEKNKVDVPKIDISKRKEIFEPNEALHGENKSQQAPGLGGVHRLTLRDHFKVQGATETLTEQPKKELKRLSGDITSIKERLQSLEQQQNLVNGANGAIKTTANKLVDMPMPPLRERLSSLKNAVTKEEVRKPPVVLIDARQLEIMKSEDEKAQQTLKEIKQETTLKAVEKVAFPQQRSDENKSQEIEETDKDDSGIHTADDVEVEERIKADQMKKEQELKLNAAIEALAKEEKQLSEAANAVNQIEAEFEELSLGSVTLPALATNSNASSTPITNEHMEYSVSSTNPPTSSSCSNNSYRQISSNNNNISQISGNGTGNSGSDTNTVKGIDIKKGSNLRRKPTNEMVHAKNLLKIFKETFQNDFELGAQEDNVKSGTANTKEELTQKPGTGSGLNIKTQIFENSKNEVSVKPIEEAPKPIVNSPHLQQTSSMIPRSIIPHGKPPISPLSIRSTTKFVSATPPGNLSVSPKNDSQFSINGRVEIFNSKTMTSPIHNSNLVKPTTTPTMTAKKIQLPHINAPILTAQSNNIVLPNHHKKQQLLEEGTTKQQQQATTVIEPLSTTSLAVTARKIKQRQQNDARDGDDDGNNAQLKSMPSEQMVNEPQANLDGETYQQHQSNQRNEAVKQQQPTEIVVCAPPITIVNPDELPKPNTVKNLSNCFQQQQKDNSSANHIAPKPLPRTRIPQITPPHSPAMPRRHVSCTSPAFNEELTNDPLSAQLLEKDKELISIAAGSTVVDIDRKESGKPNISSGSKGVASIVPQIDAQVHSGTKEKENESCKTEGTEIEKPCRAFDTQTNQTLSGHRLVLNTNDLDKSQNASGNQSVAKEAVFQHSTPASSSPFKSPLQPLQTYKSDLTFPISTPSKLTMSVAPLNTTTETCPNVITPAKIPPLLDCPPNESTLYKLANSAPHTPNSPGSNFEKNLDIDSAICSSLLTSLAVTPAMLKRQHTVEEDFCHKVDKESLPFHQISTGFKDVSNTDIKRCDGITSSAVHKLQGPIQTQRTIEEDLCQKLDVNNLPDDKKNPTTGYKCISPTEIRKCDNFFATGSGKSSSKPNSPIVQARAAHSKALIETCEKIIAEERLTSSQLKSSLPSSPIGSPVAQRKSKIPKPITSCCKATESLNEADVKSANRSPTEEGNNNGAIARLHVVETQIKVTTTTPPTSPKVSPKNQASPQSNKKTKNIFDFLKKNFGVGGHSHKEDPVLVGDPLIPLQENNVLVLSEEEAQALEKVKYDEVHKFDNSKFYIPTNEIQDDEVDSPPPLPKTPAPVNIEITRKIITDEILESGKTEKDLTREIDDLLDDEFKKLNYEIEELEKVAKN